MTALFISYRRDDSQGWAGRLTDALRNNLRGTTVFRDVDDVPMGAEFNTYIINTIEQCSVLIVLIGPKWLNSLDVKGQRRIDDPSDFVRLEIATALQKHLVVVPVLVSDAQIPAPEELPREISSLSRRQAFRLSDDHWNDDIRRISRILNPILRSRSRLPRGTALTLILVAAGIATVVIAYEQLKGQGEPQKVAVRKAADEESEVNRPIVTNNGEQPADTARTGSLVERDIAKQAAEAKAAVEQATAAVERVAKLVEELNTKLAKLESDRLKIELRLTTLASVAQPSDRSIFVRAFFIEGNRVISTRDLESVLEPFTNRKLTLTDLEEARLRLSQVYVDRGYINSGAATVDYDEGTVRMKIVEGRVAQIDIEGAEDATRAMIRSKLVAGIAPLQIDQLRKNLELISREAGIGSLHSALEPGKVPGEARLVITVR